MPPTSSREFTSTDLLNIVKALRDYADDIERAAEEMTKTTILAVQVKGVAELERADERIGIFCDNVRASLRQKTRPGMFGSRVADESSDNAAADRPRRGRPPKKKKAKT